MRKAVLITLLFVLCGVYAVAQDDYHKAELGAGWNLLHFDTGGVGTNVSEISPSGLFIDGTYYFKKNVGLTADFQYNQKTFAAGTLASEEIDSNLLSLMFGPRFKGHFGRVEPFGHGLFGFARISVKPVGVNNQSDTAFAMKFGGGIDVGVAKHFAVRVGEFNYYMTRFNNAGGPDTNLNGQGTQNNFTFSAGIVIR